MTVGFIVEPFIFRGDPFALGWVFGRYCRVAESLRRRGHRAFIIATEGIEENPYLSEQGAEDGVPDVSEVIFLERALSEQHCARYPDWTAAWRDLMDGSSPTVYDEVYLRVLEERRPDHVISWTNNHAVSRSCAALGIATHFQELGLSRRPFPPLCFWDEEGINGSSSFGRQWRQWAAELPDRGTCSHVIDSLFLASLPDESVCRNRLETLIPAQSTPSALITLQVEDDSNLVVWGYPGGQFAFLSEALLRNRSWGGNLIVKQHPLAKVSYRAFCQSLGATYLSDEIPSAWLARACDRLITQNSSTAFESALFGRPTFTSCQGVLTGTPLVRTGMVLPPNDDVVGDSDEESKRECLFSLVFQYMVPQALLFDAEYVERRLLQGRQAAWDSHRHWLEGEAGRESGVPLRAQRVVDPIRRPALVEYVTSASAEIQALRPSAEPATIEATIASALLGPNAGEVILPETLASYNSNLPDRSREGALVMNSDGSATVAAIDVDYYVLLPVPPFDYKTVTEVWLLIKSSANTVFSLYWLNDENHSYSEQCAAHRSVTGSPEWRLIRFPAASHPGWAGMIRNLRVDLFNSKRPYDAIAQVKWIALV